MSLHAKELLWQGFYELSLEIFDKQGLGCKDKQKLQLEVCTCKGGGTCDLSRALKQDSSAKVGFPAIGVLIAALILLMCKSNQIHTWFTWFRNHHLSHMQKIQCIVIY